MPAAAIPGTLITMAAYGLGSLAFGYYVVRWRTGRDLRHIGSGSTGGRNVARVLGIRWAVVSAALDVLKGVAAVALARLVAEDWIAPAMLAVVAGHVWPAQLGFRGGRGIGPGFGAVLVADPATAVIALATMALVAGLTRRLTVGGLAAVALAPVLPILLGRPLDVILAVAGLAAIIAIAHRSRWRPLLAPADPTP